MIKFLFFNQIKQVLLIVFIFNCLTITIKGAGYASVTKISAGSPLSDGHTVYVANSISGPIYFPSRDLLPTAGAWAVYFQIYVNGGAGKYFLKIDDEPSSPWNPFFRTILLNSTDKINLNNYSSYSFGMGVRNTSSSSSPNDYLVLHVKEQLTLSQVVHQIKNIQLITDADPPISEINPLPTSQTNNSFTVNWAGAIDFGASTGNGASGIGKYDVQYKVNNGSWQNWKTSTASTSAVFNGSPGNTYYFQCRAHDRVGNVEAYPFGNGDAYTTIQIPTSHDFYITNTSVSATTVTAGNSITAYCTHAYNGTSSSTLYPDVGYYLSTNSTLGSGDKLLGSDPSTLSSGAPTESESAPLTIPSGTAAGTYYILFVADYNGEYAESNESNNVSSQSISVQKSVESCFINITPIVQEVDHLAGSTSFTVNANEAWSATDNATWASVAKNGDKIDVIYEENNSTNSRTVIITVSGANCSESISVTQSGTQLEEPILTVYPTSVSLSSESGASRTLNVVSNIDWSVSDDGSWLSVSSSSGSNNGSITIIADSENSKMSSRSATVTFEGGGLTQTISVSQFGTDPMLELGATAITLSFSSGAFESVNVSSNVIWSVSADVNWLTVSPESGTENGSITFVSNSENTISSIRTATVTIEGGGLIRTLTVIQEKSLPNSLAEILDKRINIYPIPTDNNLHVRTDFDVTSDISFHILNESGQVVLKSDRASLLLEDEHTINVSVLKPGLYFLRIESDQLNETRKILVK